MSLTQHVEKSEQDHDATLPKQGQNICCNTDRKWPEHMMQEWQNMAQSVCMTTHCKASIASTSSESWVSQVIQRKLLRKHWRPTWQDIGCSHTRCHWQILTGPTRSKPRHCSKNMRQTHACYRAAFLDFALQAQGSPAQVPEARKQAKP